MFLQTPNKPVRLTTAAKARAGLNAHSHKIESIESSRKRTSPEGYAGPPSPSSSNDVMVFTNSYHGRSAPHNSRNLPEYPNIDEMQRYLQDVWDQKMRELNDPNSKLKYLHLGKPNDKSYRNKDTSPSSSQPPTPVKQQQQHHQQQQHRSSPQHNNSSSSSSNNINNSSSHHHNSHNTNINHRRF